MPVRQALPPQQQSMLRHPLPPPVAQYAPIPGPLRPLPPGARLPAQPLPPPGLVRLPPRGAAQQIPPGAQPPPQLVRAPIPPQPRPAIPPQQSIRGPPPPPQQQGPPRGSGSGPQLIAGPPPQRPPVPAAQQPPPPLPPPQQQQIQEQVTAPNAEEANEQIETLQRMNVKHIPLAKCRVLYLGSAVPTETAVGIEAVQQPLRERYPIDKSGDVPGIDAWVTIYSSGMLMQYVSDRTNVTWFPIQTLHVCAAVKCFVVVNGSTGEQQAKFVSLDSPGATSDHPPIFTAIMRRTKGVKVLECHSFICKSNQAAMAMVQSATHAYEHKEGWTDDAPNVDAAQENQVSSGSQYGTMRLIPAEKQDKKQAPPEFFENPPPQGYFYSSSKDLVKNFNVFGNQDKKAGQEAPLAPEDQVQEDLSRRPSVPPGGPPLPVPVPIPGYGPPPAPGGPPLIPQPGPENLQYPGYGPYQPYGPQPFIPVPPAGYFDNWNQWANQPFVVFPEMYGDPREYPDVSGPRRPASPSPRRRSKSPQKKSKNKSRKDNRPRSPSPERRPPVPRDARDPRGGRRHRYDIEDYSGGSSEEFYQRRYQRERQQDWQMRPGRPNTPPADYPEEVYRAGRERRRNDRYAPDENYDRRRDDRYRDDRYRDDRYRDDRYRDDRYRDEYKRDEYKRDDYNKRSQNYDRYPDNRAREGDRREDYYRDERRRDDYYQDEARRGGGGGRHDDRGAFPTGFDRQTSRAAPSDFEVFVPDQFRSNFNPDIILKDPGRDAREQQQAPQQRERGEDLYSRGDIRDIARDLGGGGGGRYPRNDREFGASVREERRILGDISGQNDNPYRINADRDLDLDMFQRRNGKGIGNFEELNGYFP